MKSEKVKIGFAIFLVMLFILFTVVNRPLRGQEVNREDNFETEAIERLDKILESQGKILEQIESVKEQLHIIQIRASG